jgi:opacity protein-like surface antigen
VPVSFRVQRYDFNKDNPKLLEGLVNNLPEVLEMNPNAWQVSGNALGLAYLPGVYLTTARDWPVNLFGQVGMGFYHYNEALEVYNFETDSAENDFATRFGGGLEANATDRLAVQTRVDYLWTDTNQARRNLVGITGGLTYHF